MATLLDFIAHRLTVLFWEHLDPIDFLESCQFHFQPEKGKEPVLEA